MSAFSYDSYGKTAFPPLESIFLGRSVPSEVPKKAFWDPGTPGYLAQSICSLIDQYCDLQRHKRPNPTVNTYSFHGHSASSSVIHCPSGSQCTQTKRIFYPHNLFIFKIRLNEWFILPTSLQSSRACEAAESRAAGFSSSAKWKLCNRSF